MSKNVRIRDGYETRTTDTVTTTTIHPKYQHLYPEEAKDIEIGFLSAYDYDPNTCFPAIVPANQGVTFNNSSTVYFDAPKYIQVLLKHTVHYVTHSSPLGRVLNGRSE